MSQDDVVRIAKSLRVRRDADYLEIFVRAWQGDDQFAVCFRAIGNQRQYVLKILDQLERDLGKGIVTFDISSPITTII